MISLITVNYNDSSTVKAFVKMAVLFEDVNHMIIVDNQSTDGSYEILLAFAEKYENVEVIQSGKNGGYGYGNNYGMRYAIEKYHSDAVLVSNADVVFCNTTVRRMKEALDTDRKLAAVAPLMKDRHGRNTRQTAWRIPESGWGFLFMDAPLIRFMIRHRYYYNMRELSAGNHLKTDALVGSLVMFRTSDILRAGGYDEDLFLYCEETVLATRLKGIRKQSLLLTDISYIHNHSTTICKRYSSFAERVRLLWESKETVLKKYYGFRGVRLQIFYKIRSCCFFYAKCRDFFRQGREFWCERILHSF